MAKRRTIVKCSKCGCKVCYLPPGYTIGCKVECLFCGLGKTRPTGRGRTRSKIGVRKDIHAKYSFRSTWEANFARVLKHLKLKWAFEERKFVFEGVSRRPFSYLMDFEILDGNKLLPAGYYEVKGWMKSSSRSKLTRLKKFYPEDAANTTIVLYSQEKKKDIAFCKNKGYKVIYYKDLKIQFKDILPNWE